jgi:hypothetical protein
VSVALYCQVVAFLVAPIVLMRVLSSWSGVVGYAMAVAAAVVWWLGVVRDHQKDDLKYLQGHISVVAKHVENLQALVQHLGQASVSSEATSLCGEATAICRSFQDLLAKLQQRESRICRRFHNLPVFV